MQTLIFEILTQPAWTPSSTVDDGKILVSKGQALHVNRGQRFYHPVTQEPMYLYVFKIASFSSDETVYMYTGVTQSALSEEAPYYPVYASGTTSSVTRIGSVGTVPVVADKIFSPHYLPSLMNCDVRFSIQAPPNFHVRNRGESAITAELSPSGGMVIRSIRIEPGESANITHTSVGLFTLSIRHSNYSLRLTLVTPTGALYGNPVSATLVNHASYTVYTREVAQFPLYGYDGLPLYSKPSRSGIPVYGGMIRAEELPSLGAREKMVTFADEPTDPNSASTIYNTTRREVIDRLLAKPWVKDSGFYGVASFSAEVFSGHRYNTGKRHCGGHVGQMNPGTTCGCVVYRLMGKIGQRVSIQINVNFYFRANYLTGLTGNTTREVVQTPWDFPRARIGVNTSPETDSISPSAFLNLTTITPTVNGAVYHYTTVIPPSRIFRFSVMPEAWLEFDPKPYPDPLPDPVGLDDSYVSELTVGWQADVYPRFQNVW